MELFKSYLIDFEENANEAEEHINALSGLSGGTQRGPFYPSCPGLE
jgi:hypothetical protein